VIEKLFNLKGKVALITGAAGSLGGAVAEVYADAGADLLLVDINGDGLEAKVKELERSGQKIVQVVGDISDIQQIDDVFALLDREFGKIDVLANIAGEAKLGAPEKISLEDVNYTIHHLLTSRFYCCQQAGKRMLKAGKGSIISIVSIGGISTIGREHFAYGMAMGGAAQLTRELSTEWSSQGVRVNAIVCAQITNQGLESRIKADPRVKKNFLRGLPIGRLGVSEDIKGLALLLASDASSFITGALIPLDGGNLAKNPGGSHPGMPEL
jgi:NAD(P)-dependent dehydrogenase (short-subunit alcohol dehydrogenase family)